MKSEDSDLGSIKVRHVQILGRPHLPERHLKIIFQVAEDEVFGGELKMRKIALVILAVIALAGCDTELDRNAVKWHEWLDELYQLAQNGPDRKWAEELRNVQDCSLKERYEAAFKAKREIAKGEVKFHSDWVGFTANDVHTLAAGLGNEAIDVYIEYLEGKLPRPQGGCGEGEARMIFADNRSLFAEIEYIVGEVGSQDIRISAADVRVHFRKAVAVMVEEYRAGRNDLTSEIRDLIRDYNFSAEELGLSDEEDIRLIGPAIPRS